MQRSHPRENVSIVVVFSSSCFFIYCSSMVADLALDRAKGERLVRTAAMAGGEQLHSEICDQRIGNVAGNDVRSESDRQGTGLGRGDGDEYHAGLSSRLALATGRARLPQTHRHVPLDCFAASHPPALRFIRFLLGPASKAWPTARAHPRR